MEVEARALRKVRTHLSRIGELWRKTDEEDCSLEPTPNAIGGGCQNAPQPPPRNHSSPLHVLRRLQHRRGSGGESETDEEQKRARRKANNADCLLDDFRLNGGPSDTSAEARVDSRRRFSGGEDAENEGDESDAACLEDDGRRGRRKRSRKSFCTRRAQTISEGCTTASDLEPSSPLRLPKECGVGISAVDGGDNTVANWDGSSPLDSGGIFEKWSQRLKQRSDQVHRVLWKFLVFFLFGWPA